VITGEVVVIEVHACGRMLAAGALQSIYEAGLRVPDDISIIGFDDTYAPHLTPPLASVALPKREIGQAAAAMMIDRIEAGDRLEPDVVTLSSSLTVRASTASPRR